MTSPLQLWDRTEYTKHVHRGCSSNLFLVNFTETDPGGCWDSLFQFLASLQVRALFLLPNFSLPCCPLKQLTTNGLVIGEHRKRCQFCPCTNLLQIWRWQEFCGFSLSFHVSSLYSSCTKCTSGRNQSLPHVFCWLFVIWQQCHSSPQEKCF